MIERLKRWLRPLRPVLGPIWHRVQPFVGSEHPYSLRNIRERRAARAAARERARLGVPEPPIRPLRHHEIVELAAEIPYYRARIAYLDAASRAAAELITRRGLTSALELGPHLQPLIVEADVMDLSDRSALRATGRRIIHDATKAPWPLADRTYDLFVALQVFEHLGTGQAEAFREVRRIARHAILSLPIDWEMEDPRNCHHRLSHERVLGWFTPVVPTRVIVGNPGRRKRLIYVFEDLPLPDPVEAAGTGTAAGAGTAADRAVPQAVGARIGVPAPGTDSARP